MTLIHSQSSIHHLTGLLESQRNYQIPVGSLALLVEHYTGVAKVMVANPAQAYQKSCENGLTDSLCFACWKVHYIYTDVQSLQNTL